MQRWFLAYAFAALSTAALAQSHGLPRGHVDRYAGEVIVRSGTSGGMNYAGAYLLDERRWFVYQVEVPIAFDEIRSAGIIEYWHDGFRVTLPRERRALVFRRAETPVPSALGRAPFPTALYPNGYGIVHIQRPQPDGPIAIQDYCSPEYPSCGPYDQDSGGGSSGAGMSCLPRSCSVGCEIGSCSADCNPGFMAVCQCIGTTSAVCSCIRC